MPIFIIFDYVRFLCCVWERRTALITPVRAHSWCSVTAWVSRCTHRFQKYT